MNIKSNNYEKLDIALEGLYFVMDPEVNLNIVDLGLVYEIIFEENNKDITVIMTLTTRFCPMGESIVEATTQSMEKSFPDCKTEVKLTFQPPWDQSMISEDGLLYLSM